MKKIFFSLLILCAISCTNDNNTFTLKIIKLNNFGKRTSLTPQKLYFKVFKNDSEVPLIETGFYPSDYTMPATFNVLPSIVMQLYSKDYNVQLWSQTDGFLGRCDINMNKYKIIFPIEMEVKNDSLDISIEGRWE